MLTPSGLAVAIGSIALVVVGRVLGLYELFLCGAAGLGVTIAAVAWVWLRRLRIRVTRRLTPAKVPAGASSRVDLAVTNQATRRTPVLRIRDAVSGTRGADLLLAPLAPGESARAAYRLPTERRGIVEVGPLRLTVTDPFGLARSRLTAAGVSRLTVYPVVHRVLPVTHQGGADPHAGAQHPNALGRSGEDFYALRPYVVGDDLRRVHWPATARHDRLMIRQDELPWQSRLTIIVDNRAEVSNEASLDLVVTIAASIMQAAYRRGDLVRVISADASDVGYVTGHAVLDAVMEQLAIVGPAKVSGLDSSLQRAVAHGGHGALVLVSANPAGHDHDLFVGLARHFGQLTSVVVDRSSWDPAAPEAPASANRRWVTVTRSAPFPAVWDAAMSAGGRVAVPVPLVAAR